MADNIFAEIYNKILGLFGQAEPKEDSKNTAVSRLRLVLMQDRTNLTPEIMHRMRSELIEVLSTYVELDKEALELNFEQEGEQMALMLSIPVVRAKNEEEIQAAIKEKDESKHSDDVDDENEAGDEEKDSEAEDKNVASEDEEDNSDESEMSEEDDEEAEAEELQNQDKGKDSAEDSESDDSETDNDDEDSDAEEADVESKKESKSKKENK